MLYLRICFLVCGVVSAGLKELLNTEYDRVSNNAPYRTRENYGLCTLHGYDDHDHRQSCILHALSDLLDFSVEHHHPSIASIRTAFNYRICLLARSVTRACQKRSEKRKKKKAGLSCGDQSAYLGCPLTICLPYCLL